MDRRKFLKDASVVLLAVQVLPAMSAHGQNAIKLSPESLIVQSGVSQYVPVRGHLHIISIPLSALANPPSAGIKLPTTWAYAHKHTLNLSYENLVAISKGLEVNVPDTVNDHVYTIQIPNNELN